MITIIEQSTSERNNETKLLFEQIRPLLDGGYNYHEAVRIVKNDSEKAHYYRFGWFNDLKRYGESQGYPYKDYNGKQK